MQRSISISRPGRASRAILAAPVLAIWAAAALAVSPVPARPDRFVTDLAKVFPGDRASALNEKLAAFERETSAQLLVYVAPKVPEGTTPEELGAAAIREWGVGQKGKNNGLVFFVFPEDRKMRIAVGYGLEGALPDVATKRIQADVVKPYFLKGDFAGGIEAGIEALLGPIRGEGTKGSGRTAHEEGRGRRSEWREVRWIIWAGLVAAYVLAWTRRSFAPGIVGIACAFGVMFGLCVALQATELIGPGFALMFGSVGALLVGVFRQKPGAASRGSRGDRDGGSWSSSSSSSSSSHSSSDSSNSSSSDFSSGGGDSGGGGSSESW